MSPLRRQAIVVGSVAIAAAFFWLAYFDNPDSEHAEAFNSTPLVPVEVTAEPYAANPVHSQAAQQSAAADGEHHADIREEDEDIVARFEELNRYQRGTQAVSERDHDLLNPGARHERRHPLSRNPQDPEAEWSVLFTADRFFITDHDSSTLTLELWRGSDPAPITVQNAVAEILTESGDFQSWPLAAFGARDGVLLTLKPSDPWPDLAGPIRVLVTYTSFGLGSETARLDFHYTGPERIPAEFIDVLADEAVGGHLVFDVAVDVRRAGQYRISALLYDIAGKPIGRSQSNTWLDPDMQTVPLSFDGLLLHDQEALGPFYLTTLRGELMNPLSATGSEQMPLVQGSYQTRQYQADEFSNQIAASPHRERMKERYKAAIARGVIFAVPDN